MIIASCHCGNISLQTEQLPATVTACNCSICSRLGALWAYFQPSDVSVSHKFKTPASYMWGDKDIAFHHCPLCGCSTHYTTTEKCDSQRLAINARMFSGELLEDISIRNFDGATSWKYID